MPQINVTKCDICGTEKKDANHWFVVEYNPTHRSIFVCPFDLSYNKRENDGKVYYICGFEHLAVIESQLAAKSVQEPRLTSPKSMMYIQVEGNEEDLIYIKGCLNTSSLSYSISRKPL